jgi:hypothetical protein
MSESCAPSGLGDAPGLPCIIAHSTSSALLRMEDNSFADPKVPHGDVSFDISKHPKALHNLVIQFTKLGFS